MANDEIEVSVGAFFDVDGTIAGSNLVHTYADFRLNGSGAIGKLIWLARIVFKTPYYALLDTFSRARFNETFLRGYKGVHPDQLSRWAEYRADEFWSGHLYPDALAQIKYHKQQGHRVALVTGGLKLMVQPLVELVKADGLAAVEPEILDGRLTGRAVGGVLSGKAKANEAVRLAGELGVDIGKSYAYADSYADIEFLECVANPTAVNPDRRLHQIARSKGWEVRKWSKGRSGGLSLSASPVKKR